MTAPLIIHMAQDKRTLRSVINELVDRANTDTRRLRVLEDKTENLTSQMNSLEETVLEEKDRSQERAEELEEKIKRLEDRSTEIERKIKDIVKRLKKTATTSKINELEEMVEIFNPMKSNFVTKEDVEKILEESKK